MLHFKYRYRLKYTWNEIRLQLEANLDSICTFLRMESEVIH